MHQPGCYFEPLPQPGVTTCLRTASAVRSCRTPALFANTAIDRGDFQPPSLPLLQPLQRFLRAGERKPLKRLQKNEEGAYAWHRDESRCYGEVGERPSFTRNLATYNSHQALKTCGYSRRRGQTPICRLITCIIGLYLSHCKRRLKTCGYSYAFSFRSRADRMLRRFRAFMPKS